MINKFPYFLFSSWRSIAFCLCFPKKSTINSVGIEVGIWNSPLSDKLSASEGLKKNVTIFNHLVC